MFIARPIFLELTILICTILNWFSVTHAQGGIDCHLHHRTLPASHLEYLAWKCHNRSEFHIRTQQDRVWPSSPGSRRQVDQDHRCRGQHLLQSPPAPRCPYPTVNHAQQTISVIAITALVHYSKSMKWTCNLLKTNGKSKTVFHAH